LKEISNFGPIITALCSTGDYKGNIILHTMPALQSHVKKHDLHTQN
jgi:hypothetical protein